MNFVVRDTVALIVAAGAGIRYGANIPKQYKKLEKNRSILALSILNFLLHEQISQVFVTIQKNDHFLYQSIIAELLDYAPDMMYKLYPAIELEQTDNRCTTVRLSLERIKEFILSEIQNNTLNKEKNLIFLNSKSNLDNLNILIHDGARPFATKRSIYSIIHKLEQYHAVDLNIPVVDTLRSFNQNIAQVCDKNNLYHSQTPQGFHFNILLELHKKLIDNNENSGDSKTKNLSFIRDDISLFESKNVGSVEGDRQNLKLTYEKDLEIMNALLPLYLKQQYMIKNDFVENQLLHDNHSIHGRTNNLRVGNGFDFHSFIKDQGSALIKIGGVSIQAPHPIEAHSDGDVIIHAITDSILGALNLGSIGKMFSPQDNRWKNCDSRIFLTKMKDLLYEHNAAICNIDVTFIGENPKIMPHAEEIKSEIASHLNIDKNQISVKAVTTEKLGFLGRGEGIAAQAICLISTII